MGVQSHSAAWSADQHRSVDSAVDQCGWGKGGSTWDHGKPKGRPASGGTQSDKALDPRGVSAPGSRAAGAAAEGGGDSATPGSQCRLRDPGSRVGRGASSSKTACGAWKTTLVSRRRAEGVVSLVEHGRFAVARLVSWLLILPIKLYQVVISPFMRPRCRFYPSCSHYAIAVIEKHGPARGLLRAIWRVLRCHPWNPGGYDPP